MFSVFFFYSFSICAVLHALNVVLLRIFLFEIAFNKTSLEFSDEMMYYSKLRADIYSKPNMSWGEGEAERCTHGFLV